MPSTCATRNYVLATKFGYGVDADAGTLGTDRIDLFQLHVGDLDPARSDDVRAELDRLVDAGSIRAYGWSTDDVARAEHWVRTAGPGFTAVQHQLNVLEDNAPMLDLVEAHGLASVNRGPLAMGLLTGKYDTGRPSRRPTSAAPVRRGCATSSTDSRTRSGCDGSRRSGTS